VLRLQRRPKTHARLLKEELGESIDHFVQAANHAAGGVGATMRPRVHAARERVSPAADKMKTAAATGLGTTAAALAPLAVAARNGGRRMVGRKPAPPPRRWPRIAILLAAGAAVGAAAAMIMRHRQRQEQQWEEYDPSRPGDATSTTDEITRPGSTTADELAGRASAGIETIDTSASSTGLGRSAPGMAAPVPGIGLASPAESPSSNSRN
jgi:hypothetical protein